MADLTHLDAAAITAFLDHDVAAFTNDLKLIDEDSGDIPSLKNLKAGRTTGQTEGTVTPGNALAIGLMAADSGGYIDGANFTKAVGSAIDALVAILEAQNKLFKDIDANLRTTLTDLLATQGSSLTTIDGSDFLVDLSEVDGDLGQTTGGKSGS